MTTLYTATGAYDQAQRSPDAGRLGITAPHPHSSVYKAVLGGAPKLSNNFVLFAFLCSQLYRLWLFLVIFTSQIGIVDYKLGTINLLHAWHTHLREVNILVTSDDPSVVLQ